MCTSVQLYLYLSYKRDAVPLWLFHLNQNFSFHQSIIKVVFKLFMLWSLLYFTQNTEDKYCMLWKELSLNLCLSCSSPHLKIRRIVNQWNVTETTSSVQIFPAETTSSVSRFFQLSRNLCWSYSPLRQKKRVPYPRIHSYILHQISCIRSGLVIGSVFENTQMADFHNGNILVTKIWFKTQIRFSILH